MDKIIIHTDCSYKETEMDIEMYIGFVGYFNNKIIFRYVEKLNPTDYDNNNNIGELVSIYKLLLYLNNKNIIDKYNFEIFNDNLDNIKKINKVIINKNLLCQKYVENIQNIINNKKNITLDWIKSTKNLAHNIINLYANEAQNIFSQYTLDTEENNDIIILKTNKLIKDKERKIKENTENIEEKTLSKYATLSKNSKGRYKEEPIDDIRTCFAIDRDRIIHCNAFKRLKGKTQVFINPNNDHFENRLTHSLETAQIARTIAKALNLNIDLAEAIMLGHDIGHTPFGHTGEEVLNEKTGNFKHEIQSIKILQKFEKDNKGLNLTKEVLDGILNHSGLLRKSKAFTMEGQIAMYADKIAYLTSDMDNAIKVNIISKIPTYISHQLGNSKGEIVDNLVKDIIYNSYNCSEISMSDKTFYLLEDLRNFMFETVYYSKYCSDQRILYITKMNELFDYLLEKQDIIPQDYNNQNPKRKVADYMSTMTERYLLNLYNVLIKKDV